MKLKFHPPDEKEYARDLCIVSYRYLCVGSDLALDWFGRHHISVVVKSVLQRAIDDFDSEEVCGIGCFFVQIMPPELLSSSLEETEDQAVPLILIVVSGPYP